MDIRQALQAAAQLENAGRLAQAEQLYRQVLAAAPDQADALCMLGSLAARTGRGAMALELIGRAAAKRPDVAEYHNRLGQAWVSQGKFAEAQEAFEKAVRLKPGQAELHFNLGVAMHHQGKLREAAEAYRESVRLKPDYARGYNGLGTALQQQDQLDAAAAAYTRAIVLQPALADAHQNMGSVLQAQGKLDQATAAFREALRLQPSLFQAHVGLGMVLSEQGHLDDALASLDAAIQLNPRDTAARLWKATLLKRLGRLQEAAAACQETLRIDADCVEAYNNLGSVLEAAGHLDDAAGAYRAAIQRKPDIAETHSNLAAVQADQGQLDDAVDSLRKAVVLKPESALLHSNLIFMMHYHPGSGAAAIGEELQRWSERHAAPLRGAIQPHANSREPERRLRIGYVSADLREHPVARFLLPLLREHDRAKFELFCYADDERGDAMTEQARAAVEHWCSISHLKDEQLAQRVRDDGIDILVDLSAHAGGNRLPMFARKPAPVQVTYLAYPGSTGVQAIDYRLTDPHLDPPPPGPGTTTATGGEQPFHLPRTYWCYQTAAAQPDVNPPPMLTSGHVTFGCLNNFCKVSDATWAAWTRLLQQLPESRLIVFAKPGSHRARTHERLAAAGIDASRVTFQNPMPLERYYASYQAIDIALDPIPYNGGTTTCDALSMGVPVVSLAGDLPVHRAGASLLAQVGLTSLVAHSIDEYVQIAINLSRDTARLTDLRRTLRPTMQASPLMDVRGFTRDVEQAYREMWRRWCAAGGAV